MICGEKSKAGICTREPNHEGIRHRYTPEDQVDTSTAEMTDSEAIETLVRTDPTHLSEDTPAETLPEGVSTERTQGQVGMFHALSVIGDGVYVAWDICRRCTSALSKCECKGGPLEPPYITKWREEFITKRDKAEAKATEKALKVLEERVETPVQIHQEPTMGEQALDAALEAVTAHSEEETDGST